MRLVIQRVKSASVSVNNHIVGEIASGMLVLIGVHADDTTEDIDYLIDKLIKLRIFEDEHAKMNLDIIQTNGSCLVISQFTLYASTKKGNRPSFLATAPPDKAIEMYNLFCTLLGEKLPTPLQKGVFGASMQVSLINDGPVTIVMDSRVRE